MGKFESLTEYLFGCDAERVVLTFAEIEQIIGGSLPPSAYRHRAFWSNSAKNSYSAAWRSAGWVTTSRGLGSQQMGFVCAPVGPAVSSRGLAHAPGRSPAGPPSAVRSPADRAHGEHIDVFLVGCVSGKAESVRPARDLYVSPLWERRRRCAERAEAQGIRWYILSAAHGLVMPDASLAPYDRRLAGLSSTERREWGRQVVQQLSERLGTLDGKVFEVHAGSAYVEALRGGLYGWDGQLLTPLAGLAIGEQLHWYDTHACWPSAGESTTPPARRRRWSLRRRMPQPSAPANPPAALPRGSFSRIITEEFVTSGFDLSARPGAPRPGWEGGAEFELAQVLHDTGADDVVVRLVLTFGSVVNRAREAARLHRGLQDLYRDAAWVFDPPTVATSSSTALADALRASGVSQRHSVDTAAWRTVAETLSDPLTAPAVWWAVYGGEGDVVELRAALDQTTAAGSPLFPLLSGPKIQEMWMRMLVSPGGAHLTSLDTLEVAVDTHVRKVTEYLGVTKTESMRLDAARPIIQQAWQEEVAAGGARGPGDLAGTAAAVDPALWYFGRWGCMHCVRVGYRQPISSLCTACRFQGQADPATAPAAVSASSPPSSSGGAAPGTYRVSDGSPAGFGTAKAEWAAAAHTVLEEVARTTGATITYAELGEAVQTATGIRTRSLLHNWIGDVLGLVGRECFTRGEPLLSSLCVRSGGDVGPGYGTLLAQTSGEQPANLDQHAAAERRRCYDWFRSGS